MTGKLSVAREIRRFMVRHPGRLNDVAQGRCLHCDAGAMRHSDGIHRSLGWEVACPLFDTEATPPIPHDRLTNQEKT